MCKGMAQTDITMDFAHCWASCKSSGDTGAGCAFEAEVPRFFPGGDLNLTVSSKSPSANDSS